MKGIVALLFLFSITSLHAQTFQWAHNGQGTINTIVHIATDKHGNSYVGGSFSHKCILEDTLLGNASEDIFLARYDSAGNELWLKEFNGTVGDAYCGDVTIDGDGNIYFTGLHDGTISVGNYSFNNNGTFLAKMDSAGSVIWAVDIGSYSWISDLDNALVAGDSGAIFLTGCAIELTTIGCSSNVLGKWLARYDSSGNCNWVDTLDASYIMGIAADHSNHITLVGAFIDSAHFGNYSMLAAGQQDVFLAQCNASGQWTWARRFGGAGLEQGLAIDCDKHNNIYLTGFFEQTVDFECSTLTSTGSTRDIFILKTDSLGNCQWVQQGSGPGNQYGFAIATDDNGNATISGSIIDTTNFCNASLSTTGEIFYAAAFTNAGACGWEVESTGGDCSRGVDADCDASGNVYIPGFFYCQGNVNFGNYTVHAKDNWIFVTKLSSVFTNSPLPEVSRVVQIYPMPAGAFCTIEIKDPELLGSQLTLYDATGKPLRNLVLSEMKTGFEKENLASGIYFYRVFNAYGNQQRGKLIFE